ncbi:MAG: ComF family protein [Chloroflexota bacterium]
MALYLYRGLWTGVDWLYPPRCAGCEKQGVRLCHDCVQTIQKLEPPYCLLCADPIDTGEICQKCINHPPKYDFLRSWAVFGGPLRQALHRLKYRRDLGLGDVLAHQMVQCLNSQDWKIDVVVPVPLGRARQKERGYNQAALLARPLAWECALAYRPKAIRRVKETRSQVGLSLEGRRENTHNAFVAQRELVSEQNVLIVDDVATTGATLDACAQALRAAGAQQVYAITLARALRRADNTYADS